MRGKEIMEFLKRENIIQKAKNDVEFGTFNQYSDEQVALLNKYKEKARRAYGLH